MRCPRDVYRELLKQCHAEIISFIRERTDAAIYFHSDGDIEPPSGDLIAVGVDILSPIQTSAGKLVDLMELKQNYGDQLTFYGTIDAQRILPSGTTDEVRPEVKKGNFAFSALY